MMREAWEALFRKEWRETRQSWVIYGIVFNLPALVSLLYHVTVGRLQLMNGEITTITAQESFSFILGAKLFYSLFVGFVLISFVTTSQFSREWDNRSFYYLLDQPVPRWALLLSKLLIGGLPVWVWAAVSVPLAATSMYVGYRLIGSSELVAALRPFYVDALLHCWKGIVWELVFTTMAVTNGLLFSVLVRRRWLGAALGMIGFLTVYLLLVKFVLPPTPNTPITVVDGRSMNGYNPLRVQMIASAVVVTGLQFWLAVRALARRQRE